MLQIIQGSDSYLLRRRLGEIEGQARGRGSEVIKLNLAIPDDRDLFENKIKTVDLFSGSQLFLISGAFEHEKLTADIIKKWGIMEDAGRTVVLWRLMEAAGDEAAKKILNLLNNQKIQIEKVEIPSGNALKRWLLGEAASRNVSIEGPAIDKLIKNISPAQYGRPATLDFSRLSLELDKLINYAVGCGQKNISVSDVALLVTSPDSNSIFNVVDAFASRNKAQAIINLDRILTTDDDPVYIFSMLLRHFRILAKIKGARPPLTNPAKELNIHPFVASKALNQARHFQLEELLSIIKRFRDIDVAFKSGQQDLVSGLYSFAFSL